MKMGTHPGHLHLSSVDYSRLKTTGVERSEPDSRIGQNHPHEAGQNWMGTLPVPTSSVRATRTPSLVVLRVKQLDSDLPRGLYKLRSSEKRMLSCRLLKKMLPATERLALVNFTPLR